MQKAAIYEFSTIFHPSNYIEMIVMAVREFARFDPDKHLFKSPSVSSALGTLLKKSCRQWIAECIKKQD